MYMTKFRKMLTERAKRNKEKDIDFGILITGNRGMGKSTLAFRIAEILSEEMKTKIFYIGPSDIEYWGFIKNIPSFLELEKKYFLVFIFDEARLLFEKRRAMSRKNVFASQLFTIIRPLHSLSIFIAPRINYIDIDWRDPDRVNWFIYLYKRGTGAVWVDYHPEFKKTVDYLFTKWRIVYPWLRSSGKNFENLMKFGIKRWANGKSFYWRPLTPAITFKERKPSNHLRYFIFDLETKKYDKEALFKDYDIIRKEIVKRQAKEFLMSEREKEEEIKKHFMKKPKIKFYG